ncbi:MAG: DUF2069 domain-containing protein [Rhodanobacteraceae bacterium]
MNANAREIGIGAWVGLVLLQFAWYPWLAPPTRADPLLAWLLTVTPLLLPLLSLRRGLRRALLWAGILSLAYFCHGVVVAWLGGAARWPALIEVVLCVILVATLGWDARSDRRHGSNR